MKFFIYKYTITNNNPFFNFRFIIINRRCLRLFHVHTGRNDYSLLWILSGNVMDLFFKRLK
jgi:hypothetical protein